MNTTLYHHPDGMGAIQYDAHAQTLCLSNDNDSTTANASIGPLGLRELAANLLALADKVEGK